MNLHAWQGFNCPWLWKLLLGHAPDIFGCFFDGFQKLRAHAFSGGPDFFLRDPYSGFGEIGVVEFLGVIEECGVTALAYVGNDFGGDCLWLDILLCASREQPFFSSRRELQDS